MLLRKAGYPTVGGEVVGHLLKTQPIKTKAGQDDPWSTALMVRYRNRRAFLQLLADPAYAPYEPYKFMALEIDLVPVSADTAIPDLRWIAGGALLTTFLAIGWRRAAHNGGS